MQHTKDEVNGLVTGSLQASAGGNLLLEGDGQIGKSRFTQETARRLGLSLILLGREEPTERAPTYDFAFVPGPLLLVKGLVPFDFDTVTDVILFD